MDRGLLAPFESPARHAEVSDIIRRRSTNHVDVREAALLGLDLSFVRSVLDLGCGFGFMSEAVARRVARDARIIGIDACSANEQPYLKHVGRTERQATFVARRIERHLDWPDGSFDLVIASYALYYFPQVLPDIARVLSPRGLFLATTHSEKSCRDLLSAVGVRESGAPLMAMARSFSAESGARLLAPWFGEVDRVDYHNSLAFDASAEADLLTYLRFKLPLLLDEPGIHDELPQRLAQAARIALAEQSRLVLDKTDAAFRCRIPRCS